MSAWRGIAGAVVSLTAVVALLGAATHGFRVWTTDAARAVAVAAHPISVPAVTLVDEHRAPQFIAATRRATIVDFVYTRCVTLCGTLGATYQQLQADIVRRGVADRVRLLTISFDPTWDTPERLRYYAIAMHPDPAVWTIATFSNAHEVAGVLRTFGIRVIADGAGGFVHNAALHVVNPAGQLVAILPIDARDDAIDAALAAVSAAPGPVASAGAHTR
ncbi:SCO family protein [Gemmatimonas groenlandica]|uniref:SCO family protein n=1 Tax=Gemmatimonas groenlandica TaxID=2732249 RepID=UPI00197E0711|nr:SCO family protein [Gemmatimonas groenlandica]